MIIKMNQAIHSEKAPAAIGPYSQAILAGNTLYISGQIALSGETGELVGADIETQTRQVLTNVGYILHEAGFDYTDVVKTTVFLKDMSEFVAMNGVYASFFKEPYPARAAIEIAALPKGARVEIEAVAVK